MIFFAYVRRWAKRGVTRGDIDHVHPNTRVAPWRNKRPPHAHTWGLWLGMS